MSDTSGIHERLMKTCRWSMFLESLDCAVTAIHESRSMSRDACNKVQDARSRLDSHGRTNDLICTKKSSVPAIYHTSL
ncbi:hypothetical protein ALC56_05162 [Trachymyrmex septentrionalis]|uniref:Uncharacterized protein n=1 Tax=Trachymyrmex septentrionalis TaxID=34720 RepID=A0A195FIX6_9HYME|nr:hypothetical protein ALC56_05162 [Trachymyrmex septentrionalis]